MRHFLLAIVIVLVIAMGYPLVCVNQGMQVLQTIRVV